MIIDFMKKSKSANARKVDRTVACLYKAKKDCCITALALTKRLRFFRRCIPKKTTIQVVLPLETRIRKNPPASKMGKGVNKQATKAYFVKKNQTFIILKTRKFTHEKDVVKFNKLAKLIQFPLINYMFHYDVDLLGQYNFYGKQTSHANKYYKFHKGKDKKKKKKFYGKAF